ncbi:DUF2149 domain-containing protein [Methanobacterium formicicum]|jgi:hypothetical protein|uniref:DUF2149 domain-containing protein n=1 Tax=Methanobacterium formicicum (strain DSM 3637 / PP1) TaxID=1204725 RepID=K2RFD8_METFP|nr:DUF2149 domain-containing protein [Methanobacterium formicicum]EKF87114.1 hypothetical protein A994_02480 [Methanobacterium formicicum DSM 3637]
MIKQKMHRRRKELLSSDEEIDPMIYAVNMVDCMLVLAVGFLIFTIMSMGLQSVVFSEMSPQEKSAVSQAIKEKVQLEMGQQINETIATGSGGPTGYENVGKVYKDPQTGKLILIQNT